MRFAGHPRRRRGEASVVPMINVVFLLLIFFMIAARIAPPPPLEVALPEAVVDAPAAPETVLYIDADGTVQLAGAAGADPWAQLAAAPPDGPVTLRADAGLPAPDLARLLGRLAALGIGEVALAVVPR